MWLVWMLACGKEAEDTGVKLDPVAEIEVSPTELDFGEVRVSGAPSEPMDITIENVGTADLTLTAIRVYCLGPFTVSPSDGVVAPGGVLHASVIFDPTEAGEQTNLVEILSLDEDEPVIQVALSGTGT